MAGLLAPPGTAAKIGEVAQSASESVVRGGAPAAAHERVFAGFTMKLLDVLQHALSSA